MLFSFTIGNYRSFSGNKTLSLEPAAISEYRHNIISRGRYDFLTTAVIYGANSSGKTNLLRGLEVMKRIVDKNFESSSVGEIPYDPYLLNTRTAEEPSFYEVIFLAEGVKYRYGFTADKHSVLSEWLFCTEKRSEKPLFIRVREGIEVMRGFPEGKGLEEKTRDNALFLSVADQFNGPVSAQIMAWFRDFNIISGLGHNNYRRLIYSMLEHPSTASMLNDFFRSIDLGFEEIRLEKRDLTPEELSGEIPENMINNLVSETGTRRLVSLRSTHRVFNDEQQITGEAQFDVRRRESSGTNKIVDLSGPVFDTLLSGGVLGVDELDASLHPLLTLSLVKLFQNPEINKKGAQLIFSTHDTNLLSICELRRDQIYFVEKDRAGASDLYSLVEYDRDGKVRKDRSFEKDYINGRYGAIPYFGEFDKLMY